MRLRIGCFHKTQDMSELFKEDVEMSAEQKAALWASSAREHLIADPGLDSVERIYLSAQVSIAEGMSMQYPELSNVLAAMHDHNQEIACDVMRFQISYVSDAVNKIIALSGEFSET